MTSSTSPIRVPAITPSKLGLGAAARRLVRGDSQAAVWERPAFLGLLAATAVLYLWNIWATGWSNSFYTAAVQAGSTDLAAFFYGSSDAANSITVDKPPAALWLMVLSVKLFGLTPFAVLLPEALMGVASAGTLYAIVRRRFSAGTALMAGAIFAITPVATLMFRYNNPDALLVLLTLLATYFTLRGVETGHIKWVLWAGVMVGLGFLTKQLQAFLVLPVLAGVYLAAAPLPFVKRLGHSFAALGAVIVSAGWWVAIVELMPAELRPYIGGSQTNSFLELTFGYNGFGRLTGDEVGSVTQGGGGAGSWGDTGLLRMFTGDSAGQISWLLPAALIGIVVALVLTRRLPRTSPQRATILLIGGTVIVTGLAFSLMGGIFHAYYTVALAPVIAGSVAIGAGMLWARRERLWSRIMLAVLVGVTGAWSFALLSLATDWLPWLKFVVLALAVVGALMLLLPRRGRGLVWATAAVSLASVMIGPAAYSVETLSVDHSGGVVTAGPAVAGDGGGGGNGGPGANAGQQPPTQQAQTGQAGPTTGTQQQGPGGQQTAGATGGLLDSGTVSEEFATVLSADAADFTWIAAAVGSNSAAGFQIETQLPVMPIGGFNGSDPSPTLEQFQAYVADGEIHWFISGGGQDRNNGDDGSSVSAEISAWVEANFTAETVDGSTIYDLTVPNA